ncbi:MAG TPA: hypothetical protein VM165_20965 [Planctomycetaceae bacterium]|nr:hypothetical protein [Planctomycetaceae bacterium]
MAAAAAVVMQPQMMAPPPPVQPMPPSPAMSGPLPVPVPAAAVSGNKTAMYAMAGLGGAVVLLIGVVIALMMGRDGDSGTSSPVAAAQPVENASLVPTPAAHTDEEVAEQPILEALPGDLQSQVAARQKEVSKLQQALVPLRSDKQRLETEIQQLTDSE